MKLKRLITAALAAAMLISAMAIPASAANTGDTYYTYNWSGTTRNDYTPARYKQNSTYVYIRNTDGTLPMYGYYVGTYFGTSSGNATTRASAANYHLNDYNGHTIRPNGTTVSQSGKYVRIRGYYPSSSYSWGNATIAWSPDTANQSNYSSLN